jgi:orotidine-5'-phosphate decarboxylase
VDLLAPVVDWFKVGVELYTWAGPAAVQVVAGAGKQVFLDLKFHDIPATVSAAGRAVKALPGVALWNVHAAGGGEMLSAAAAANRPAGARKLLGVTVLTSLDDRSLPPLGIARSLTEQVVALAELCQEAGLDGVVASPREVAAVRAACGPGFLIVTPGVRPEWAALDDQRRVMTPAEAVRAGSDYLVVGRPITGAVDPLAAARRIIDELTEVDG